MSKNLLDLPQTIIVFDTEFTAWEGAEERKWSGPNEYREIVQIGAVKIETATFSELDSFNVFIKPVKNPQLSDYFINLTKITQEKIDKEGMDFSVAIERFAQWSEGLSLYSWGDDSQHLKENCVFRNIPFPFSNRQCKDIKPLFAKAGIPVKKYKSSTIIAAFSKQSVRRAHDGLNDARGIVDALKELAKQNKS